MCTGFTILPFSPIAYVFSRRGAWLNINNPREVLPPSSGAEKFCAMAKQRARSNLFLHFLTIHCSWPHTCAERRKTVAQLKRHAIHRGFFAVLETASDDDG